MFDTLAIYQPELADQLRMQLKTQTFSQVHLFGGNRYTLRLSFALETARVLCCHKDGSDDCGCDSCRRFRTLSVSNVLFISQRDHKSIIETSLKTFERLYNDFSKFHLITMIKRLLLQYHPALLIGTQSQSTNNAATAASLLNELLIDIAVQSEWNAKEAKKCCSDLRGALKTLYSALKKNSTITIGQVRAIEQWVGHSSVDSGKRIIILEAMEQTNASARNSLLKMLEEPPADTYIFLISEEPGRIMQTILSRVRRYTFKDLSPSAVSHYLEPFYIKDKQYDNLETFYLEQGGMDLEKNQAFACELVNSTLNHTYLDTKSLSSILEYVDSMQSYEFLLKHMLKMFGEALNRGQISTNKAYAITTMINAAFTQGTLYNQNGKLMLESLYYRMMEEA